MLPGIDIPDTEDMFPNIPDPRQPATILFGVIDVVLVYRSIYF